MRYFVLFAVLMLLIPCAAYAGNHSCGCSKHTCGDTCKSGCGGGCHDKCQSGCTDTCKGGCQEKCHSCKPKCETGCKSKCDTGCKSKSSCNSCGKVGCNGGCKSACGSCGKVGCNGGCQQACGGGCAKPCACDAWDQFCGCGTVSSLCITITACEGTAGPMKLQLRDTNYKTVAVIELPGPIDCYYNFTYTFDKPVDAASLQEAVLINDTEDPATITSLRVVGMDGACFSWVYVDHTCPGALLGPGGCKRMVVY
jgi:hypothetical protein